MDGSQQTRQTESTQHAHSDMHTLQPHTASVFWIVFGRMLLLQPWGLSKDVHTPLCTTQGFSPTISSLSFSPPASQSSLITVNQKTFIMSLVCAKVDAKYSTTNWISDGGLINLKTYHRAGRRNASVDCSVLCCSHCYLGLPSETKNTG